MEKLKYIFTIVFANIITAYIFFNLECKNAECSTQKRHRIRDFSGIILEKYINKKNHSMPYLKITNQNQKEEHILVYPISNTHKYRRIMIGDSISKLRGELDYKIYRDEEQIEVIEFNFDCEK